MKKSIILAGIALAFSTAISYAQMPDTTGIYSERYDSLDAVVAIARQSGNYLSKGKDIRTEIISAAGICKMACCNLAESFENSASVSVGYSDAVTGARQIRLLGQSGIYTQMLDENRPTMRGLSAPWGLTFIPSQWLESIQVAKGVSSVINGVESMTGQINLQHRKTTDEKPLYVQASYMSDTKADLNIASSLQLDSLSKWSTVVLAHVNGNFKSFDTNSDGFMDDPRQLNIALSNRWLYFDPDGTQVQFGIRAIQDKRKGGQMDESGWRSNIGNRSIGGFAKAGIPLSEDGAKSIAAIADYTWQGLGSNFGTRIYNASQSSAFLNILFQDNTADQHHYTFGVSDMLDAYKELFCLDKTQTALNDLGLFGEYTFHSADQTTFSAILGLRGDWYNMGGLRFSPRLSLKWAPLEQLILRANGGRGIRYSTPLTDNIGVLSTGKTLSGDYLSHPLEDAWTMGGNATWYLPFDEEQKSYLSIDFFHTVFKEQMLVDYVDESNICFRTLTSLKNPESFSDNLQLDFSVEPLRGLSVTLTGRLTNARQSLDGCLSGEKPMTSRYKGVLNLQYATNLNKWIFDFTASVNGPCKVWDFMEAIPQYRDGYTQVYPLLYAQITKRFKGFDLYVGGENLTNFTQKDPIIGADKPGTSTFDASCIWAPLTGIQLYAGLRMTIWKTY